MDEFNYLVEVMISKANGINNQLVFSVLMDIQRLFFPFYGLLIICFCGFF